MQNGSKRFGDLFFQSENDFLFKARYIRLRYTQNVRDFFLRFFLQTHKYETHLHNFLFALIQLGYGVPKQLTLDLILQIFAYEIGFRAQNIAHKQFVAFPVDV